MKSSSKAVVIYKKKILLLLRDNIPGLKDANKWSLPGGILEPGETHKEALERELKEEINIVPQNVKYIGSLRFLFLFKHSFFIVRLTTREFRKVKLGNEGQKLGWFKVKDLENVNLGSNLSRYFKAYKNQLNGIVENKVDIKPELLGLEK